MAVTGIPVIEHICHSTQSTSFGLFSTSCQKEKESNDCCKPNKNNKKKCCENKFNYERLDYQGHPESAFEIRTTTFTQFKSDCFHYAFVLALNTQAYLSLRNELPPDKFSTFLILYKLRPQSARLQVFRC